ncbi:hypothetical protein [Castellaniella sp.]|nr:hypothetical protein [Castellaniella sp.]
MPGKKGRRFVDKLVQVRLRAGTEAWLLIHALNILDAATLDDVFRD